MKRKFALMFLAIALGVASAAPAFAGNPESNARNCATHTLASRSLQRVGTYNPALFCVCL